MFVHYKYELKSPFMKNIGQSFYLFNIGLLEVDAL